MPPIRVIPPPPGPASFQGLQAWYKADSFVATHREPGSISGLRAHYKADGLPSASPDTISGLAAWYDFSDASTLFQDAARTTPVASQNDPIGGVEDKSGSGRHLSQSTAGKRPLYDLAGGSGGRSVASFDGTDDHLLTSGMTDLAQPGTVIAFFKYNDARSETLYAGAVGAAWELATLNGRHYVTVGSQIDTGVTAVVGSYATVSVVFNGASTKIYSTNGDVTFNPGAESAGEIVLGIQDNLTSQPLYGRIAEVVYFDRVLTSAEIQSVEVYLANKYVVNTNIREWTDVAGGFTASQATNANRPLYVPSVAAFNNKPTVRFVTDDRLDTAASIFNLAQPYQVIVVAKTNGVAGNSGFVGNSSSGVFLFYQEITSGKLKMYAGINQVLDTINMADAVHVISGKYSGTTSVGTVDGVNIGTTAAGDVGANALTDIRLGDFGGLSFPLNGDLAEVMVYDRALTAAEQEGLELYLANKYGVTSMAVGQWANARGSVAAASQATGSAKPRLVQDQYSGKPALRFDGVDDTLSATIPSDSSKTLFVVTKKLSAPGAGGKAAFATGGTWQVFARTDFSATDWMFYNVLSGNANLGSATTLGVMVLKEESASVQTHYRDGGVGKVVDPDDAGIAGTGLTIGSGTLGFADVDVLEVLLYDNPLSLTAINVIGRYLAQKWGTTWTTAT